MRIVLVVPPWTLEDTHPPMMRRNVGGTLPPTGLLSMASVLRGEGHEVAVLDGALLSEPELVERVGRLAPNLVGISVISLIQEGLSITINDRTLHYLAHPFFLLNAIEPGQPIRFNRYNLSH